jgi:hypothetical protein
MARVLSANAFRTLVLAIALVQHNAPHRRRGSYGSVEECGKALRSRRDPSRRRSKGLAVREVEGTLPKPDLLVER